MTSTLTLTLTPDLEHLYSFFPLSR